MPDIVSLETRSRMMSGIRGKDTQPEMIVRKALWARGFRYSLHKKTLPGKPDLYLARYKAVIDINGCFWHGHNCSLFKWPGTRQDFWKDKISGNQLRDRKNVSSLLSMNLRVLIVWECALRRKAEEVMDVIDQIEAWILSDNTFHEILDIRTARIRG